MCWLDLVENCSKWDFSQLSTKISSGPGFLEIFENFVQFLSIWNCHKLLSAFSERELIRGFCLSNISMQHEKRKFSLGWQNEVSSLDSNNLISTFRQLKPDAMLSAIKSSWKISTSFLCSDVSSKIYKWQTNRYLQQLVNSFGLSYGESDGREKGGSLEKWDKRVKSVGS